MWAAAFLWNVDPEIVSFGSYGPRWYGLCFATGILLGYQLMRKFYMEAGLDEEDLNAGFVLFVVGTVVGARLGHTLFYEPEYYLARPWKILAIWEGGLASHGGTLGIILCMIYYTRKYKVPFMWLADRLGMACALGVPWIRIGNFLNSEILGRPTDLPWAVIFKRVDDVPRHPAQLYEAISYFVLFLILYGYYKYKKGVFPSGRIIGAMFIGIFSCRFFIEFIKENQVEFENGMSLNMGQLLSLPLIAIGLALFFGLHRKLGWAWLTDRAPAPSPAMAKAPQHQKGKKKSKH